MFNNIEDVKKHYVEYSISSEDLFAKDKNFKENLIVFSNFLKLKYKKRENDFAITFSDFLELLEFEIYSNLPTGENLEFQNTKLKLEIEVARIIKKTRNQDFEKLLTYVKNCKEFEIDELKELIVKIQLKNNIFPTFLPILYQMYNNVYAWLISKNNNEILINKYNEEYDNKKNIYNKENIDNGYKGKFNI